MDYEHSHDWAADHSHNRNQEKALAFTIQVRTGLESLDLDRDRVGYMPAGQSNTHGGCVGPDDEEDGDLQMEEPEASSVDEIEFSIISGDEEPQETLTSPSFTLSQITGRRTPPVLMRLLDDGGSVRVEPLAVSVPVDKSDVIAMAELVALVAHAFRDEQEQIWKPLLDKDHPPDTLRCFEILIELALGISDKIQVANLESGKSYNFSPKDRVFERFQFKYALLPNGVPFCLGLLLRDGRGQKSQSDKLRLLDLPIAVQLIAIQRVLHIERNEKIARTDSGLIELLYDVLSPMGINDVDITDRQVARLRSDWIRKQKNDLQQQIEEDLARQLEPELKGLEKKERKERLTKEFKRLLDKGVISFRDLFPNREERQKMYDTMISAEEGCKHG